jgi:hypothetical protein
VAAELGVELPRRTRRRPTSARAGSARPGSAPSLASAALPAGRPFLVFGALAVSTELDWDAAEAAVESCAESDLPAGVAGMPAAVQAADYGDARKSLRRDLMRGTEVIEEGGSSLRVFDALSVRVYLAWSTLWQLPG